MGAGLVGAITVGVYPTSPTRRKWPTWWAMPTCDIIVCEDQEQTDKVLAALPELPRLKKIVVMETKGLRSFAPEVRQLITTFDEVERWAPRLAGKQPRLVDEALARQTLDDIGLMIYTSGSTGKPKGAMISYRNIRGVVPGIVDRLQLTADTDSPPVLPAAVPRGRADADHLRAGVPGLAGATSASPSAPCRSDLREVAPTMFLGVPRIWEKMHAAISIKLQETGGCAATLFYKAYAGGAAAGRKAPQRLEHRPSKLTFAASAIGCVFRALQNFIGLREARVALTGAAPIPPDVVRFFRVLGVPLVEVYGLTESTGMVTGHRSWTPWPVGTVGVNPPSGVEWRIAKWRPAR